MDTVWTWGGKSFGYFDGENLWTYDGKHVGKRKGDEIYGPGGNYIGEVMGENRLITNLSKKGRRSGSFSPHGRRVGRVQNINYIGYVMQVGYTDFPHPDDL